MFLTTINRVEDVVTVLALECGIRIFDFPGFACRPLLVRRQDVCSLGILGLCSPSITLHFEHGMPGAPQLYVFSAGPSQSPSSCASHTHLASRQTGHSGLTLHRNTRKARTPGLRSRGAKIELWRRQRQSTDRNAPVSRLIRIDRAEHRFSPVPGSRLTS